MPRKSGKSQSEMVEETVVLDNLKGLQDQMAAINSSIVSLTGEVSRMRCEIDHFSDLKDSLEFTQSKLADTQHEMKIMKATMDVQADCFDEINKKMQATKTENTILKEKLLYLDTYIRRENLKFSGIPEDKKESNKDCKRKLLDVIKDKLGIESNQIQFQRCHRLGPKTQKSGKSREIIARFLRFGDRQEVWFNRNKLKNTNIVIHEDFPFEIEERRSKLYPSFKAARKANKQASLIGDKLYIEGRRYTVDTLNEIPADFQPSNLAVRENDHMLLFYGRNSVFSNFFSCQFVVDAISYSSIEQYFQSQRALKAGDEEAMAEIMKTSDPVQHLKIGRKVHVDSHQWNDDIAKQIMEKGIKAKFEQNNSLKQQLLATKSKMMVQCKYDPVWGVGMGLHNDDVFDKAKWKGNNALGSILVAVREELK